MPPTKKRSRAAPRRFLVGAVAAAALILGGSVIVAAATDAAPPVVVAPPPPPPPLTSRLPLPLPAAGAAPVAVASNPAPPPRAWDLAALPLVYYQPETSFGAIGQVFIVRRLSTGSGAEERHDTLSASFTATWRRQYAVTVGGMKFWNQDRDRLKVDVVAQRFPSTFWGLGNDTPEAAADLYTPLMAGTQINYSHRVIERIFVGMTTVIGYYRLQSFEPGGAVADYLTTRRRQGALVAFGPNLVRDSRDDSNYPRAGSLSTATFTAYLPAWLSDYRFLELDLDQRTFFSLPWSSVLALQAYGQVMVGEAPIELLPPLGGPNTLRGYFQGRYRDKVYLVGQTEWRVPLFWRLGAAVFGAIGDVFPDVSHINGDHVKAAGGAGLRLNVGGRNPVNIRADFAVGRDTTGLYLLIGEAI